MASSRRNTKRKRNRDAANNSASSGGDASGVAAAGAAAADNNASGIASRDAENLDNSSIVRDGENQDTAANTATLQNADSANDANDSDGAVKSTRRSRRKRKKRDLASLDNADNANNADNAAQETQRSKTTSKKTTRGDRKGRNQRNRGGSNSSRGEGGSSQATASPALSNAPIARRKKTRGTTGDADEQANEARNNDTQGAARSSSKLSSRSSSQTSDKTSNKSPDNTSTRTTRARRASRRAAASAAIQEETLGAPADNAAIEVDSNTKTTAVTATNVANSATQPRDLTNNPASDLTNNLAANLTDGATLQLAAMQGMPHVQMAQSAQEGQGGGQGSQSRVQRQGQSTPGQTSVLNQTQGHAQLSQQIAPLVQVPGNLAIPLYDLSYPSIMPLNLSSSMLIRGHVPNTNNASASGTARLEQTLGTSAHPDAGGNNQGNTNSGNGGNSSPNAMAHPNTQANASLHANLNDINLNHPTQNNLQNLSNLQHLPNMHYNPAINPHADFFSTLNKSTLSSLLIEMQLLSKQKWRCSNALTAMMEGRVAGALSERGVDGATLGIAQKSTDTKNENAPSSSSSSSSSTSSSSSSSSNAINDGATTTRKTRAATKTLQTATGASGTTHSMKDATANISSENSSVVISTMHIATRDAHLIMATTQAINMLLKFLNDDGHPRSGDGHDEDKSDYSKDGLRGNTRGGGKSNKTPKNEAANGKVTSYVSVLLSSLSYHLLQVLVNDRLLMETITSPYSSGAMMMGIGMSDLIGMGMPGTSGSTTSGISSNIPGTSGSGMSVSPGIDMGLGIGGLSTAMDPKDDSDSSSKRLENKTRFAKAVIGRGMTSAVMGALWSLEALSLLQEEIAQEEKDSSGRKKKKYYDEERVLLRRSIWTCLLSLEVAFQLNPRPRLLTVSSVCLASAGSTAGNLTTTMRGGSALNSGATTGGSSGLSGIPNAGIASSVPNAPMPGLMDFDGMMSAVSAAMMGGMGGIGANSASSGIGAGGTGAHVVGTAGVGGIVSTPSSSVNYSSVMARNHAHSTTGSDAMVLWNQMLQRILADCEVGFYFEGHERENQCLGDICSKVTELVDDQFVSLVLGTNEEKSVPPKKTRRTSRTSKSKPKEDYFLKLSNIYTSYPENNIFFTSHVSVRRWAMLAFGWLCKGQKRLLEVCIRLLQHWKEWSKLLELNTLPVRSTTEANASSTVSSALVTAPLKTRKKKKEEAKKRYPDPSLEAVTEHMEGLPGHVALVTFVSCIIDMIYDAGATSGLAPPASGWMDDYVRILTGGSGGEDSAAPSASVQAKVAPSERSTPIINVSTAPSSPRRGEPVRRSTRTRSKTTAVSTPSNFNETTANDRSFPVRKIPKRLSSPISNRVWIRPDIRNDTAILASCLVQTHVESLSDEYKKVLRGRCETSNTKDCAKESTGGKETKGSKRKFEGELSPSPKNNDSCEAVENVSGIPAGAENRQLLINDDDYICGALVIQHAEAPSAPNAGTGSSSNLHPKFPFKFYPFIHRTLETLGRTASAGAFFANSDTKSRIMSTGSAVALRFLGSLKLKRDAVGGANSSITVQEDEFSNDVFVLDAKLYSMALIQLSDCLGSAIPNPASGANTVGDSPKCSSRGVKPDKPEDISVPKDMVDEYRLNEPLETLFSGISGFSKDFNKGEDENDLDRGARYRRNTSRSNATETLALFLRAQLSNNRNDPADNEVASNDYDCDGIGGGTEYKQAMNSLLQSLVNLLRLCYNFGPEQRGERPNPKKKPPKRKKKKADFAESNSSEARMRKTLTRCVLASDTLNTLRKCLTCLPEVDTSNPTPFLSFRSAIRFSFTPELLLELIQLGYTLEDRLIYRRLKNVMAEYAMAEQKGGIIGNMLESSKVFESWERRLWSSHIKLCLTIGRGQAAFGSPSNSGSLLNDRKIREIVFRGIAAAEKQRQLRMHIPFGASADPFHDQWPLCLPAFQHALVASSLSTTKEPNKSQSDVHAELFLCNSFLNSVQDLLDDLSPVTMMLEPNSGLIVNDIILLSLRDARLFALAAASLPRHNQKQVLTRYISILHSTLLNADAKSNTLDMISRNSTASRFLARVITLCSSFVDLVVMPDLTNKLSQQVGMTHYGLPRIKSKPTPESERCCFSREVCYQGLFTDWESPALPICNVSFAETLQETDFKKLEEILQSSLGIGFETSGSDGCHLLYSSWNASGKLSSWSSQRWDGPSTAFTLKQCNFVQRLMKLREDMCEIHSLVLGQDPLPPGSLLAKGMQNELTSIRPNEALLTGLKTSEEMFALLTSELCKIGVADSPSLPAFAFYEALPVYASFLISMHSHPGANDMGATHRFQKSKLKRKKSTVYTNEDDMLEKANGSDDSIQSECYPDFEEDESDGTAVRINALARLHDACLTLGAAPCYPDWLDKGCRLREGISPPVAIDSSEKVLLSLTHLGTMAFERYCHVLRHALTIVETDASSDRMYPSLALQTIFARQQLPLGENDAFYNHVSTLCQVSASALKLIANSLSNQQCLASNGFVSNAAQRIKGAAVIEGWEAATGEHRANCQWETMLSEVLRGSSLQVSSKKVDVETGVAEQVVAAVLLVHRWRRVLFSVVSAMVPTSALLQFGVCGAKGRRTHPLCEDVSGNRNIDSSDSDDHLNGTSGFRFQTKNESGGTVEKVLSFLSCLSAYSTYDDDMHLTARAAASHLLNKSGQFRELESLWKVRVQFEAIGGIVDLLTGSKESQHASGHFLIEELLKQMTLSLDPSMTEVDRTKPDPEQYEPRITPTTSLEKDKLERLLAFFGLKSVLSGRLIGSNLNVDLTSILAESKDHERFGENSRTKWFWRWGMSQTNLSKLLLTLLCRGKLQLDLTIRTYLVRLLTDLIELERLRVKDTGLTLLPALVAAADEWSKEEIYHLVRDICYISDSAGTNSNLNESLAVFVGYLAGASTIGTGEGCRNILAEMSGCLYQWVDKPNSRAIVLICMLAARFGALKDVGINVLSLVSSNKSDVSPGFVESIKSFFEFLVSLDQLSRKPPEMAMAPKTLPEPTSTVLPEEPKLRSNKKGGYVMLSSGIEVLTTCSFIETGEGFTEQHWYNCYTCGLLWDKGCCSLCARVCHAGHDVGYSRKSSFFCDCGAEAASAIEQNRTPCKCLSPLPEKSIRSLYDEKTNLEDAKTFRLDRTDRSEGHLERFAELVAKSFPSECKRSLELLVTEAKKSEWNEVILRLLSTCYQNTFMSSPNFSLLLGDTPVRSITGIGGPNLEQRRGEPLKLKPISGASMLPLRASKANALQIRTLANSGVSRVRKSSSSRSEPTSQLIASDDRGRLIIAESTSVLFCTAIPAINMKYEGIASSHLSRAQLNILGSDRVKFQVSGIALCNENNRHLLLWGVSEVCVAIMTKEFDSFERIIDLKLQLEPSECESEYLLACEWMPHSELMLIAVCGTVVHIFDLKRSDNNTCKATTHYALAYEDVLIRSAVLTKSVAMKSPGNEIVSGIRTKLALLLDTGRLHFIDLAVDEDGDLEDQGESYIECGAGVSFPTTGIRRYCGGHPITGTATATTFGEGLTLTFLRQSNLLIYQCVNSCAIAMFLDNDGSICGSFEILPYLIPADDFGSDGSDVSGPYTHFQELGVVTKNESIYYRVACVGESVRSNQPKLLLLEFNENSVFIKELARPMSKSASLGLISNLSFVGSCAFSAPYLVANGPGDGFISSGSCLLERAYLSMLTSNGSLLWFGEDCSSDKHTCPTTRNTLGHGDNSTKINSSLSRDMPDHSPASSIKRPPLRHNSNIHIFESLINVSELDELVFGGDCVNRDPKIVKKKLSLNNNDFVISPSRDGCTLTASLQNTITSQKHVAHKSSPRNMSPTQHSPKAAKRVENSPLAIVAVRVLVGSMPDLIPHEIIIMGRSIKLKKGVKRWYDFPLTDHEILLAIRNGFVTIWISPCHDSSNCPIIDSVEVYAQSRSDLACVSPGLLVTHTDGCPDQKALKLVPPRHAEDPDGAAMLVSCIQSVTFLTRILGQSSMGSLTESRRAMIKRIIEQTALYACDQGSLRDHTVRFLNEIESDAGKRTFFVDESTLRGSMQALQGLQEFLKSELSKTGVNGFKQKTIVSHAVDILSLCLQSAISIAQKRGGNYRKSISAMVADGLANSSLAIEGKRILDFCRSNESVQGGSTSNFLQPAQLVVELILMEIACSDSLEFARFDSMTDYLKSTDFSVVKACCIAIRNMILGKKVGAEKSEITSEDPFITYQCDSCKVFPITGCRFIIGGEHDIDLCKECFELGMAYARTHDHSDPVVINGHTLNVDNEEMTCAKIWQMTSKPIAASSLEEAEEVRKAAEAKKASLPIASTFIGDNSSGDEVKAVETAVDFSMESPSSMEAASSLMQTDDIEVVTTNFRSQIFAQLLDLSAGTLRVGPKDEDLNEQVPSHPVLQLVIDLVLDSGTEELKSARGKQVVLAFTNGMSKLIEMCRTSESSLSQRSRSKLVICLRTLACLVMQRRDISRNAISLTTCASSSERNNDTHSPNKDKTDPRYVCEVHGVPAVRRRCSHGVNKDRRFYVCGLERKHRCGYFVWVNSPSHPPNSSASAENADHTHEEDQEVNDNGDDSKLNIFTPVQTELLKIFSENGVMRSSLHEQFCDLVGLIFRQMEQTQDFASILDVKTDSSCAKTKAKLASLKSEVDESRDIDDGVLRSREKFGRSRSAPREKVIKSLTPVFNKDATKESLLCALLDLLSLIAPAEKWSSSDWYSILCEIISTSSSTILRMLAKKILQRLCGGRRDVYHRVRDHYVFGFQFRKLLQQSEEILDAALIVREQARQCGPHWRGDEINFTSLSASGLLGVEDLISEDCYAVVSEENISSVLDELIAQTRARGGNWRQFCGLPDITAAISSLKGSKAGVTTKFGVLEQIYQRPPIISLLWLACCLREHNQIKAMTLIDIALTDLNSSVDNPGRNSHHRISSGTDEDNLHEGRPSRSCHPVSDPERSLLKCLTIGELHAFIAQFVLHGRSPDLRSIAVAVAHKLARRFSFADQNQLLGKLVDGSFREVGQLGSASRNFFDLIQLFVERSGSELDLTNVASYLATSFVRQMTTSLYCCRKLEGASEGETHEERLSFDLSNCVHCHRQRWPKKSLNSNKGVSQSVENANDKPEESSSITTRSANVKEGSVCNANFLPDQVRPYQKSRLETSTATSVSSEFASYNQLKFRVALSQVHVSVSDPRGRLVKTIAVYFTPRQVSEANDLKSSKYSHFWQRCGTLTLARGSTEASFKLKTPVIAANLKFEYLEFYEKLGGMRASDGSLILHCPRCTRQVNNAHGVCGNCGEVAFQCRKCRHINYDRLDAFLCVECGYCASGGFNYEVTVGIALNAVAILDEDGFQRSMAMLRIAGKRQGDIRNSLKKKILIALREHRERCYGGDSEDLEELITYGPALKRAFLGGLPKSGGSDRDDGDSSNRFSSSSSNGSTSRLGDAGGRLSAANKARSLISLARQLRAENSGLGSENDRLGRGDLLVRQALLNSGSSNGGAAIDFLDDVDESLFSALSAASTDPLSRLVANIHARVRSSALGSDNTRNERQNSRDGGSGSSCNDSSGKGSSNGTRKDEKSQQSHAEECDRLYSQMREAERECHELNRRIDAWNRLNKDALAEFGPMIPFCNSYKYISTSCSVCCYDVTYQILSLLLTVFSTNISQSETTLNMDLIKSLLNEREQLSPKLLDLKRRTVIKLASTSEQASECILHELQSRLQAVGDVASAEILGKLIELDFPTVDKFIELAISVLN